MRRLISKRSRAQEKLNSSKRQSGKSSRSVAFAAVSIDVTALLATSAHPTGVRKSAMPPGDRVYCDRDVDGDASGRDEARY
jgi:hypothetical protein